MKFISRSVLLLATLFATTVLHAQLNNVDLSTIEATTPLSADQLPPIGTFYSASDPGGAPAPGDIFDLPGWDLGNGIYLLDDLGGSSGAGS